MLHIFKYFFFKDKLFGNVLCVMPLTSIYSIRIVLNFIITITNQPDFVKSIFNSPLLVTDIV